MRLAALVVTLALGLGSLAMGMAADASAAPNRTLRVGETIYRPLDRWALTRNDLKPGRYYCYCTVVVQREADGRVAIAFSDVGSTGVLAYVRFLDREIGAKALRQYDAYDCSAWKQCHAVILFQNVSDEPLTGLLVKKIIFDGEATGPIEQIIIDLGFIRNLRRQ